MLDISSSTAKVAWAGHHLEELRLEYRRVMIDEQHFAVPELDAEHAEYVFRFQEPTSDLQSLGLIVGDVVHNLRSALDHLAWQMAETFNVRQALLTRGIREPERRIMYPLSSRSGHFQNAVQRWIGELPRALQNLIESTQPHQSGYEMLAVLGAMAITDKHRIIPVIVRNYGGFHLFGGGGDDAPSPEDWHAYSMRGGTGPVEKGDEIMRVPVAVYAAYMEREPQLHFSVELADAEGFAERDVYAVMYTLHELVRDRVLPKFAQFVL